MTTSNNDTPQIETSPYMAPNGANTEDAVQVSADAPKLAPRTRTIIYIIGAVLSYISFVILGIAPHIGAPEWISVLTGLIATGYGSFALSLGVANRPTKFPVDGDR